MTNLEAFNKGLIIQDDSFATIILKSKSIDPTGEDETDNSISLAWGFIYSITAPDYTQGKTSEKLTATAAKARKQIGIDMLRENDIYYNDASNATISSIDW